MNSDSSPLNIGLRANRTVVTTTFSPASSHIVNPSSIGAYNDGHYVLHVACGTHQSFSLTSPSVPLSCALSDRCIVTYDRETLKLVHSIDRAHRRPITDLCFLPTPGTNVVMSSGEDGLICIFDLRQNQTSNTALKTTLPPQDQALSLSLGYGGTLAAVGSNKGLIHFFDLRQMSSSNSGCNSGTLVGTYVDAHADEVTKVRFQTLPDGVTTTSLLVSASEDGLACVHDTSKSTEELALESVLNVQCPLRDVGFFGSHGEGLYCITGSETISIWHHYSAQCIRNFGEDLRYQLSSCTGFQLDYLVGCHWDDLHLELSLLAGNSDGNIAMFQVDPVSMKLTRTMTSGHSSCVRAFTWLALPCRNTVQSIITGGEDSRICEWILN